MTTGEWISFAMAMAALITAVGGIYAVRQQQSGNIKRLEFDKAQKQAEEQRLLQDQAVEHLQKIVATMQEQIDRKDAKIAMLETKIEAMQADHTDTLERLRQVEQENVVLTEQVGILQTKVKELTAENHRLKGRRKTGNE